jgi:rhamnosyltransferase
MKNLDDQNTNNEHRINHQHVCAVVVAYNPELELLDQMLTALAGQVGEIVVVDNSTTVSLTEFQGYKCSVNLIKLGGNYGIARAHNIGIQYARDNGYKNVILMDQDSLAAPDMVEKLLMAENQLLSNGEKVASIGPQVIDSRKKISIPFIISKGKRLKRFSCKSREDSSVFKVEHLISSGSLIALGVLDKIGEMEEGLFIDYVDIEWAYRARKGGYSSYAACGSILEHHLGDRLITLPFLRNRRVPLYSPERHYYNFRNAFSLYKRRYIPFPWKIYHFSRHILFKFLFFSIILPPRRKNCKMMLLGIFHCFCGIDGALEKKTTGK